VPLTFPVFSFGGSLLPTATESTVINPRREVTATYVTVPKAAGKSPGGKGPGGKAPAGKAPAGKAAGGGGGDAGGDGGDRRRRQLLNWGHDDSLVARAPSYPQFTTYFNPPPAIADSRTTIVGDKVNLDAAAKIPGKLVNVRGTTNAVFGPQRPLKVGGKGDWTVINLSRDPSTVVHAHDAAINWGSGGAVLNNGNPLSVTHIDGVVAPNPNMYTGFTFRPQLGDRPDGFIEAKSRTNVPLIGTLAGH